MGMLTKLRMALRSTGLMPETDLVRKAEALHRDLTERDARNRLRLRQLERQVGLLLSPAAIDPPDPPSDSPFIAAR